MSAPTITNYATAMAAGDHDSRAAVEAQATGDRRRHAAYMIAATMFAGTDDEREAAETAAARVAGG